jgi:hypothetical protein
MENGKEIQTVKHQSMQLARIEDVRDQIQAIEACIKTMMVENRHYGKVPGCGDKKCLLKPGAEMLAKLFQIRPEFVRERRDLGNGHFEVLSSCTMYSHLNGVAVGEGAGTCSTMESKYRWRKAQRTCPKCEGSVGRSKYPPANDKTAQPGWYCTQCKAQFAYSDPEIRGQKTGRVENPDIADVYNTVQKIADKRAYVAAVITTTGASDYVTQDITDFDEDFPKQDDDGDIDQTSDTSHGETGDPIPQAAKVRGDLIKQAEAIVLDGMAAVTEWAIDTGKIKKGQTWKDMEIQAINTIIKSGKGFMVMVNNHVDGKTR